MFSVHSGCRWLLRKMLDFDEMSLVIINTEQDDESLFWFFGIYNTLFKKYNGLMFAIGSVSPKKKESTPATPGTPGSVWKKGPMQCPLCGSMFKTYAGYQDHVNAVHEKKKFICDVCARQCSRRSQLTRHMLTHGGERRFECGKCGRRFLLREMLRRHLRAVHARVRPHLCNLCGRPFAEKHQLNTHMKVHRR